MLENVHVQPYFFTLLIWEKIDWFNVVSKKCKLTLSRFHAVLKFLK